MILPRNPWWGNIKQLTGKGVVSMILDSQMTELGYALKSYRVRNNITQQELAERLGVSTNTIHLWETKVCKPSMGSLLILSDMLNEPLINIIEKSNRSYY